MSVSQTQKKKSILNLFLITIGTLALLYLFWAGYEFYKMRFYKPTNAKKQELIQQFMNQLKKDGINTNGISIVDVKYNHKSNDFSYIVKVEGENYTYNCAFAIDNKLYCDIENFAYDKIPLQINIDEVKQSRLYKYMKEIFSDIPGEK